jgi:hypothetical protein
MKLNQFESSISFIHNALPGYLRKLYERFLVIENELYAQLEKAYGTNPYSVNKYLSEIMRSESPTFIQIFKYIMSEDNQLAILSYINDINHESLAFSKQETDEEFETIVGADIIAPLQGINIFISSFLFRYNSLIYKENLPIICIEPEIFLHDPTVIQTKTNNEYHTIYNENGTLSLFNRMHSILKIDINHVFTFYFYELLRLSTIVINTEAFEETVFERYRRFHDNLHTSDEVITNKIDTAIGKYISSVRGSAILCYMTYASKLIGAKEDMMQWLYTTFVKGTVSDIESGDFFKTADITAFSGHQQDGSPSSNGPTIANFVNKSELDREKMRSNQFPDKNVLWNPNILYKYIRLNYSNWCTVINVIANMSRQNSALTMDDIINNPDFRYIDTDTEKHISMARFILIEYISHYFATYNVFVFPVEKEITIASFFIKFVSNRIFNSEIKSIISFSCINVFDIHCKCIARSCPHPRKITDYFVNSKKAIGSVYSIKLVKNILADLFMTYSYIIMLNGVYNTQDRIFDEQDTFTGKSKKELFLEIYHSLLKKINLVINYIPSWKYQSIVVCNDIDFRGDWNDGSLKIFDSYLKSTYTQINEYINNDSQIPLIPDIKNIRNALSKITTPLTFNADIYTPDIVKRDNRSGAYAYFITKLYDIHPISVLAEINEYYKLHNVSYEEHYNFINEIVGTGFTRSGNLFPHNRITSEVLNKIRIYTPKLFTSFESASEIILKAKEDAILGNNANYSFIGGLGGSVTGEEENIDELVSKKNSHDSSIHFTGLENFTDGDPLSIHKNKVNNLVNSWIDLFKIAILGGKDIVIPQI